MKFPPNNPCPCGSNLKYKKCCKTFHDGVLPKTALELMKSRYSAYAVHKIDYIISTTHNANNDFTTDIKAWGRDIKNFCENIEFKNLEIIEFIDGEIEAFVTFRATLIQENQDVSFTEKSRFLKENNKWFYESGVFE